jgi:hypothetical protein
MQPLSMMFASKRFLDRLCTHLIDFEGDSQAKMYPGNWSDYETMMQEKSGKDLTPPGEIPDAEEVGRSMET